MLSALLRYWKVEDEAESALFAPLKIDPVNGSRNEESLNLARQKGLQAEMREGVTLVELAAALRRGETVILDIQAWRGQGAPADWTKVWEEGHHVALVGMDADFLYLMDPMLGTSYGYIPRAEFLSRWHDYEVVGGVARQFHRLAIFVRGAGKLHGFPDSLRRVQ